MILLFTLSKTVLLCICALSNTPQETLPQARLLQQLPPTLPTAKQFSNTSVPKDFIQHHHSVTPFVHHCE